MNITTKQQNGELLISSAEVQVLPELTAQMTMNNEQLTTDNEQSDNLTTEKYCAKRNTCPSDNSVEASGVIALRQLTCEAQRELIATQRPLIKESDFVYLSLTLFEPKGTSEESFNVNVDFRLTTTPRNKFNKLIFSLSNRVRDFKRTIQDKFSNWEDDQTYGGCIDFVKQLRDEHGDEVAVWIGKGRPRKERGQSKEKAPLADFACMAMYAIGDSISGRLWFEDSIVDFEFDPSESGRGVMAKATPIKTSETITNTVSMWM